MVIIGIDCGLTGAMCVIRDGWFDRIFDIPTMANGKGTAKVKRQVDPAALADMIREIRGDDYLLAVVERVSSMPGQGSASIFSLGDTAGAIRGVLATLKVATEWVTPQSWKKAHRLGSDKDAARSYAIQRFPEAAHLLTRVRDHNRGEALLIAAFGYGEFA